MSKEKRGCSECESYEYDSEYQGCGSCQNEKAMDKLIFNHCDMFLIADDFGCKYFKKKGIKHT